MPAVISLAGDWDIFGRAELRRRLSPAYTAETCIIDFADFHCGDATFLDELIYMGKVRKAQGHEPALFVISREDRVLRRILELTKLAHVWPTYESMQAALEAAGAQMTIVSGESRQ